MGRNTTMPIIACLALILATGVSAEAATVLRFGLEDLTDRAAVIVHGKVAKKSSRKAKFGAIVTDLQLEILEPLKGVRGRTFSFSVYGGIVGDRGSTISGAPTFSVGEEVLVFLDRTNKYGLRAAIGLAQGKYSIREVEGRRLAFRDMEGLRLMDLKNGDVEDAKPEQGRPFDELLDEVKKRLAVSAKKEKK